MTTKKDKGAAPAEPTPGTHSGTTDAAASAAASAKTKAIKAKRPPGGGSWLRTRDGKLIKQEG